MIILAIAFGITYVLSNFPSDKLKTRKTNPNKVNIPFTKHADLSIISASGDTIKNINIEIADSEFETQQGLMYRSSMKENNGMLFVFKDNKPRHFYMRNTRIGLDIIYINDENIIVSFAKDAKPYDETSLPSTYPAKYVLEINDGLVDKWRVKPGDKIVVTKL
ncbi:MAG: DUF192 domain-containing protein [Ichthyobacteriaceae bacterium]|nr:DUF192 domain-containing protein [Ichthyobacteriaceae bacterium]